MLAKVVFDIASFVGKDKLIYEMSFAGISGVDQGRITFEISVNLVNSKQNNEVKEIKEHVKVEMSQLY